MLSSASRYAIILAGVTAIIVYGSLYPFDFTRNANTVDALQDLLSTWRSVYNWGNVIGNALLYIPFGFCLVRAIKRGSGFTRVLLGGLAGFALCAAIEVAQVHDRNRDSSMSDVYANTAGAFLGAAAGVVAIHGAHRNARFERHPFSSLMLLCWFGNRLFPFLPAFSIEKYRASVKPLAAMSAIPLDDLYRNFANWLVVAILLEAVFGFASGRRALPWIFAATLAARIVIVRTVLSPAELVGGAAAVLIWIWWLSRLPARAVVVAVLFTGSVIMQALEPFKFNAVPRAFGLIPFRSMMGTLENTAPAFFEKAFTYGALVWLAIRAGISPGVATASGAFLVLVLRLIQVYLPGRSAEITDTVMLLLLAAGLKLMGEDPAKAEA